MNHNITQKQTPEEIKNKVVSVFKEYKKEIAHIIIYTQTVFVFLTHIDVCIIITLPFEHNCNYTIRFVTGSYGRYWLKPIVVDFDYYKKTKPFLQNNLPYFNKLNSSNIFTYIQKLPEICENLELPEGCINILNEY